MKPTRYLLLFLLLCTLVVALNKTGSGFPATSFTIQHSDWHDNWGINRNYYGGSSGYLPNLAFETLNENKELAYSIGQQFQDQYPSKVDCAVAILKYVQTWTEYGYDSDNVVRDGIAQDEWAWNADEMAHAFDTNTGVKAIGDCEDMAFLCGTIYEGAGFDAAIVDASDHVALLIWLPEFSNADNYWDLPDDNRDAGWIWVEATGSENPLGWTPPDYENGGWTAYSIGTLEFAPEPQPSSSASISINLDSLVTIIIIVFSIILVLSRIRRR
jgi:hypothetical protein